jgi:hypothetical protein
MGGLALIVFLIMLVVQWRGGSFSVPIQGQVWIAKILFLIFLLSVFSAATLVGQALLAPAIVLLIAPSLVLRWIVVPLGLPRVAYWIARCCWPIALVKEPEAGAAFYGTLALARRPSSAQSIGWLDEKANRAQVLRGAGVVAGGLLAALRGEGQRARCLFLIADTMPRKAIPRCARAIARDWLVVDAARIGNWREVVRLGRRGKDSLRWSYAVARIAERIAGNPDGCHDWLLCLYWMLAPRRQATLLPLRRALATQRAVKVKAAGPRLAGDLPAALANLAHVLQDRFGHDGRSLARSVCLVEAQLKFSTTRALVQRRTLALDARHDTDAIFSSFRKQLVDFLVPLIEKSPNFSGGKKRGPIVDQAIDRVRVRLFRDIEIQCKDYDDRLNRESSLDTLAEWEAWALTRDSADRLLELNPISEDALFQTMYVPVCNFAVFQHNKCKRIVLAHDMFRWLHRHAQSDSAALQLLSKNMRAGGL